MTVFTGTAGNDILNLSVLAALNSIDPSLGHVLQGLEGNDRLFGASGNDTLIGAAGNDQLDGGSGADSMDGGAGNDSYVVDNVGDTIVDSDNLGQIQAFVSYTIPISGLTLALRTSGIIGTGTSGNELIISYASNTTLNGLGGHDVLKGGDGSTVNGGAGNDILEITASGTGTLKGGTGDDIYNVYYIGNLRIDESISSSGGGTDTIFTTVDNVSLQGTTGITFVGGSFIENLTLAAPGASLGQVNGPITGSGNSLDNVIIGNRQNNFLYGFNGNDTFYGSFGNDVIDGGSGNDSLFGEEGNDTLIAGTGTDTLTGGNGNDVYTIDSADTIVELTSGGDDTVNVSGSWSTNVEIEVINVTTTSAVTITLTTLTNTVGTQINVSSSSQAGDNLTGGSGNDTLSGKVGSDALTGGGGVDTFVFGGSGLALGGSSIINIQQDTITDFGVGGVDDVIRLDATNTFTALTGFIIGGNLLGTGTGVTPGFATFSGSSSNIDKVDALMVFYTPTGGLYYNANGGIANGVAGFGFGTGGGLFATINGSIGTLEATDFSIV